MTTAPPITRDNPDWLKLKLHFAARIRKLQRDLEAVGPTPQQHDVIRGRIAELRDFLKLVEPDKLLEESEHMQAEDYYDGN